jgi:integrase
MNIRKRGRSWQVDGVIDGRRFRRQFKTAAEAEAFVRAGREDERRGHTLGELYASVNAARWVSLKSTAMSDLGNQIVNHLGAETPVRSITASTLHDMVSDLKRRGKANGTVNRWIAGLGVMLRHALDLGWIDSRPEVKPLKEPSGRNRFLTSEEEREIVEIVRRIDDRTAKLVVVLADTGLRLSEAIDLRWRDVANNQVSVHDTKNGLSRTVPLSRRAGEVLASLPRDTDRPFSFTDRHRASHIFTRARELSSMRGDKEVVMHTLRHTCASRLVQRGVPIAVVSAWLGHKCLAVTMRYSHLRPDQLHDYAHVLERSA